MSFQPLVSCIIPVYNAEKYLHQGLESLLVQTYQNIEIILIDDQSTDSSWAICKEYSEKFSNVKAFRNKVNSGAPLRSRERGIEKSSGEWITFMDCDDYVKPEYVANLVEATNGGQFDIAVTGYSRLHSNGKIEEFLWKDYSQTTEERLVAFYEHFLKHDFWTDPTDTSGQNLIRASICKKTDLSKYTNLVYAEDTLMALAFLANSENGVNFVDKHDFVWRQVEGSGSHGGFSDYANKDEFFKACFDIFHTKDIYNTISKNSPVVSIIVPVYNVEQYLAECLESVIDQTYKNLEIIIVNDGTTDTSQTIVDSYKRRDGRIISIKQKNQGLNTARANGTKIASGEYIAFVDSDDIVDKDYIKIMYENLVVNDVDISVTGFRGVTSKTETIKQENGAPSYSEQVIKDNRDVLRYYLGDIPSIPNVHQMTAWGKLYRAYIVKSTDWSFSNYKRHEDNLEALQWYKAADKGISVLSVPLYFYRTNPNSITQTIQNNINPKGQPLNYFEFIHELYFKIKEYIDDESLNVAILNQLANTNRSQVRNLYFDNKLDQENMESATNNWDSVIALFNQQIQLKDQIIKQHQAALRDINNSPSWKITKPFRVIKRLTKKLLAK